MTLKDVIAESGAGEGAELGVCAVDVNALAHTQNAHSTRLPNFLMFFLWFKSQLISAQNQ
jgi:hypothetical protein